MCSTVLLRGPGIDNEHVDRRCVAEGAFVSFLDVTSIWGTSSQYHAVTATDMALAYTVSDPHPTRRGHADMAWIIHEAITSVSIPAN